MDQPQDARDWQSLVYSVLQQWHNPQARWPPLEVTFLFSQTMRQQPGEPHAVSQRLIHNVLERVARDQPDDAALLRVRFIDQASPRQVAQEFQIAESTLYRFQSRALERLAVVFATAEEEARGAHMSRVEQRLEPATAAAAFGIEQHVAALIELLTTPGQPWLVCIEGIGGIGKTTLANQVVRQFLGDPTFAELAWVSARPRIVNPLHPGMMATTSPLNEEVLLEALGDQLLDPQQMVARALSARLHALIQERLRQSPHLVVIDNLESEADLIRLRPLLQRLINPTKFLLTSRFSSVQENGFFSYRLGELEEADALALVRYEARIRNVPELISASHDDLRAIYATVGGNPLALRLVVGQSRHHGLFPVLGDLEAARGTTADRLYQYIFWHAWHNLDRPAQEVFLAMPLAPGRGATLDYLQALTELETGKLGDALNQLLNRNLVDSHGDLHGRRYTIHSLTRTFLLEQVLKWLPPQGGTGSPAPRKANQRP